MAEYVARRRAQDDEINYLAREAEAPPENLLLLAQRNPYGSGVEPYPVDPSGAEFRGTGPGESRDLRAYAKSGFAGGVEDRLAEGVFQGAMQKAPLALPFMAQVGGIPKFRFKDIVRKSSKTESAGAVAQSIDDLSKRYESLTGTAPPARPRPLVSASQKEVQAGDIAYRDNLAQIIQAEYKRKRDLIAKAPKTSVPAPLGPDPSIAIAAAARQRIQESPYVQLRGNRGRYLRKAEETEMADRAVEEAMGGPTPKEGPWGSYRAGGGDGGKTLALSAEELRVLSELLRNMKR